MADGVFNENFGDTIKQALLMRYQAQQAQAAREQAIGEARLKARGELLGRMTLTGPQGQQPQVTDLLQGLYSGAGLGGFTAQPTPAFAAAGRDVTQQNIAGQKTSEENKALGVKMRQQWGASFPMGTTKPASFFAPAEVLKSYGIDPSEKIGGTQKLVGAGGKGGGKTPEDRNLAALKAKASTLAKQLQVASKESQARFGASLRAPTPEETNLKAELDNVNGQIQALTARGTAGAGGSSVPTITTQQAYDALPAGAPYMWNGVQHVKGGGKS